MKIKKALLPYSPYAMHGAFIIALSGTLGSLYLSDVLHMLPCNLCWYQRILLYPLVVILGVGILRKDKNVYYYVLPMSLMGMGVALYHHLLQIGIISETLLPCTVGVSCATKYINWFGFVTLPLLSFIAFSTITGLLFFQKKYDK